MFSTNQHYYIDSVLGTCVPAGYKYYIAYQNTNIGYYSTEPDLYIIVSKEKITASDGYTYVIPKGALQYSIMTGNYSSNSSANNDERVVVSEISQAKTLSIDSYEHIYTNAEFKAYSLQPDYYSASGGATNVKVETISFIMLVILIYCLLRRIWFK